MAFSTWRRWLGLTELDAQASTCVALYNQRTQALLADRIEIADRGASRRRGLLGRHSLEPGEGLWIIPCEAVHTVGMRFALDLIFLDRKHVVRKIRHSVPPWRLSGALRAQSVLELAAGTLAGADVRVGDTLHLAAAEGSPITG